MSLAAGESVTRTLSVATGDGDAGTYTATVSTEDDSDGANVTVQAGATFEFTAFDATVSAGTASVTYEVTNTGRTEDTTSVTLTVDGQQTGVDTNVTLAPGASTGGSFDAAVDPPTTLVASTADDTASVSAGASVSVDTVASTLDVVAGERVEVAATVANTGDLRLNGTVALSVNGTGRGSNTVDLAAGAETQVTLGFLAGADDDGATATVSALGDAATATVGVDQSDDPAALQVDPGSVQFETVEPSETVTETITIANVGGANLTLSRVELRGDDTFELTDGPAGGTVLGPGESRTVTVAFTPETTDLQSTYLYVQSDAPTAGTQVVGITSGAAQLTVTVDEQNRQQVEATFENATAGETVVIDLPDPIDDEAYRTDTISVTPAVSGDLTVTATSSNRSLGTSPETKAGFPDNTTRLGNLSVTANVPNEDLEAVEFEATVERDRLAALGADPADISFYRFDEDAGVWVERDTELRVVGDEAVVVGLVASGFSEWTAAAARPEFSISDTDIDVNSTAAAGELTIRVFVQNTGGTDGTYVADLLLNGELVDTREAIIADGGEELFQFERSLAEPGIYEVLVNDVFVADVNVTGEQSDDQRADDGDDTGSAADGGDGFGPGFGVVTALGALLAALLGRRWSS